VGCARQCQCQRQPKREEMHSNDAIENSNIIPFPVLVRQPK